MLSIANHCPAPSLKRPPKCPHPGCYTFAHQHPSLRSFGVMQFLEYMLRSGRIQPVSCRKYAGALYGTLSRLAETPLSEIDSLEEFDRIAAGLRHLDTFANLNKTGNNMYSSALRWFREFLEADESRLSAEVRDLEALQKDMSITPTERLALTKARAGQGDTGEGSSGSGAAGARSRTTVTRVCSSLRMSSPGTSATMRNDSTRTTAFFSRPISTRSSTRASSPSTRRTAAASSFPTRFANPRRSASPTRCSCRFQTRGSPPIFASTSAGSSLRSDETKPSWRDDCNDMAAMACHILTQSR